MEDKQEQQINHPKHYNQYSVEAVDMAIQIWGKEAVQKCAEITAFFYRMRLGLKDDINKDLAKEKWWLDKAKELAKQLPNLESYKSVMDSITNGEDSYQVQSIPGVKIRNPYTKLDE